MISLDLSKLGFNRLSFYLALEQYIIDKKYEEDVFFLWRIDKSIIIGRNQLIYSEVNLDYANKINCEIFRRPSGGGGIFADSGCFMFTFVTKESNHDLIYKKYLTKIINSLNKLNVSAYFSGRNDLLFQEKKFSGNSIYFYNNYSILHGTFLYDSNLENLVKVLTVSNEKLISKGIKSIKERVINLKPFLSLEIEDLMDYLVNDIGDKVISLTDVDIKNTLKIQEKFDSKNYIYGKNPRYSYKNIKRFNYGQLEIYFDVVNNKINEFLIYGDYFELDNILDYTKTFINLSFDKKEIINNIIKHDLSKYINNATNEDLISLIEF